MLTRFKETGVVVIIRVSDNFGLKMQQMQCRIKKPCNTAWPKSEGGRGVPAD